MKDILHKLLELQALDFGDGPRKAARAAALRAAIPPMMLEQYERRRARGKKGIALVRNRVCTGCRMQVPIGVVAALMRGTPIQVCGNCGLYLSLPESPETEVIETLVTHPARDKGKAPRHERQLSVA
ncbi:MAG TPA: hypothetical protein VN578_16135 [Candidatus Binatia bacterium]|jgi:predicted  nucleic acid-binding Zn-ribbon protein|nr:hypothetical protein [Candidatus Binatia bacterium]